jgi:hypothetical protein
MPDFLYTDSKVPTNSCSMGSCYKSCNNNMASNNPATQYQRQKIIQNTVRVKSSLYTMNLGALNVYQKPNKTYSIADNSGGTYLVSPGVNWNQMSDRRDPHVQVVKSGSGSTYGASSTRRTITRLRPGALSPGGSGVDVKHNSYERYLNRIKGKGPIRRGSVPSTFGSPYIPFNRAFPIYGGKTIKTSIVSGCDCPEIDINNDDINLYKNSDTQNQILNVTYTYHVGDFVWAKKYYTSPKYEKAIIIDINDGLYTVIFEDDFETVLSKCDLLIYFDCSNCVVPPTKDDLLLTIFLN